MSSTILYKFRSGQNFEALPLPGSAARLYDVKKAIVLAKKLNQAQSNNALEFDLSVRDASTDQEYVDESMVLPRGTRLVVQRLPAARGHGFLARMARMEAGMMGSTSTNATAAAVAPSGFYTIDSRANDEEEFVSTNNGATAASGEDSEMAALMAVTGPGTAPGTTMLSGGGSGSSYRPTAANSNRIAGSGPPPPRPSHGGGAHFHHSNRPTRPNADPELRDQQAMPKKRATGIPRTFLNLSAPPVTDGMSGDAAGLSGGTEGTSTAARLQPNVMGFEELVNRGGGQSEITTGTKRDLDYALKLTATDIPEHLQCGICHNVVKNAMLLPWDVEGRTACETCIRDALSSSGFRCPLTGMEGVSPDDLHPNYGLRKAAELFIKGVMEKMDEIDRQAQMEEPDVEENETAVTATLEGERGDKGVIVSRRTMKDHKRKNDDDPFGGGDDDFGGDVFDVARDEADEDDTVDAKDGDDDKDKPANEESTKETTVSDTTQVATENQQGETVSTERQGKETKDTDEHSKVNRPNQSDISGDDVVPDHSSPASKARDGGDRSRSNNNNGSSSSSTTSPHGATTGPASAEDNRRGGAPRRGPPAGYAMGPAGGAAVRGARKSPEQPVDRHSSPAAMTGRGGSGSPYSGGGGGAGAGRGAGGGRGDFFGSSSSSRGSRGGRFGGGGRFEGNGFGRGRGGGRGGGYPQQRQQGRFDTQENRYTVDGGGATVDEDDVRSRGSKHSRSESEDFGEQQQHQYDRFRPTRGGGRGWSGPPGASVRGGGRGFHNARGGGRAAPPPYGGGGRGGSFNGRGAGRGGFNGEGGGGFNGGAGGGGRGFDHQFGGRGGPPPPSNARGGRGGGRMPPYRGGRGGYRGRGRY